MKPLAPCGTVAAYRRHRYNGQDPCGSCRAANATAERTRLQRPEAAERTRELAAARREIKKAERRAQRPSDLDRLMRNVKKADDGCWHWTGAIARANGYGRAWLKDDTRPAHIAMYLVTKGAIPDGYEIDHTCHNLDPTCPADKTCLHRRCVNPDHLEAVSSTVNNVRRGRRKTHCPQGHEYTPQNTRLRGNMRHCRRCHADRQLARSRRAA